MREMMSCADIIKENFNLSSENRHISMVTIHVKIFLREVKKIRELLKYKMLSHF